MSDRKHKGDHGRRAERYALSKNLAAKQESTLPEKPRRVFLRNGIHIWATLGVTILVAAVLVGFEVLGLWDNVIGSVLSVLVGAFGCMCVFDLALLLTACITFGEGMVNAGKDELGQQMVFHAASVVRLEMRGKNGKVLPQDLPVYKNAEITFVMESGRVNRRAVSRLTRKQYARIREALAAEQAKHI